MAPVFPRNKSTPIRSSDIFSRAIPIPFLFSRTQTILPPQTIPLRTNTGGGGAETVEIPFFSLNRSDQLTFLLMSRDDVVGPGYFPDFHHVHGVLLDMQESGHTLGGSSPLKAGNTLFRTR